VRFAAADGLPDWWAAVDGDASLLGTATWLRALGGRIGDRPVTFAVHGEGPLAALHATVRSEPAPRELFDLWDVVAGPAPGRPLTDAARAARAAIDLDPAACVPYLLVMYPGYECFPVGPAAADPAVLRVLVDGIVAWARAEGMRAVGFLYCGPDAAPLQAVLGGAGFAGIPRDLSFDLDVPGPTFGDYLRALPKKRRVEANRELRQLAASGVTVTRPGPDEIAGDLVRLRMNLSHKYGGSATPSSERARLDLMLAACGPDPAVFAAVAGDGTVVSAAMFGTAGGVWTAVLTGSEYDDPRSRFGYFATAYYEPVRAAGPLGVRQLRYGVGSFAAKRARGCVPTPRTAWVRALDPALDAPVARSAAVTRLA
jgi:hypothetical protein